MFPSHKLNLSIIANSQFLEDEHIDYFALLLHNQFHYAIRESWYVQHPEVIEQLDANKEHIQILHSRDTNYTFNENEKYSTDHWVCSYYDTKRIYIFDSANRKQLHEKHKIFLEKLYPGFTFNSNTIEFPDVQKQPNNYDCGVYAIAFATSLALGEWPINSSFLFDHNQMRNHSIKLFKHNIIISFPKILGDNEKVPIKTFSTVLKEKNVKAVDNNNNVFSTDKFKKVDHKSTNNAVIKPIVIEETNASSKNIRKRKIETILLKNENALSTLNSKNSVCKKNVELKTSKNAIKNDPSPTKQEKKIETVLFNNNDATSTQNIKKDIFSVKNSKVKNNSKKIKLLVTERKRKVQTTLGEELLSTKRRNTSNKRFLPNLNDMFLNIVRNGG